MKNNLKNLIKLGIFIFGILLFTISCQKDNLPLEETITSNNKQVFTRLLNKAKKKKANFNKKLPKTKGQNQISAKEFDATFEAQYGEPLFDKSINLTKEDGTPILVTPLLDDNGLVVKLLIGYLEDNEEEFRVIDESVKTGNILYVNGVTQETISCPKTNIGTKQLGGLFETSQRGVEDYPFDCGWAISVMLNSVGTGCYEVDMNLDTCVGVIYEVECNDDVNIDEDGAGGPGNGADPTGGNEGSDPLGNNNVGGTNNSDPNNPLDSGTEPPCNICGDDPFDYVAPIINCINGLGQTDGITLSQDMIDWLQQNNDKNFAQPINQFLSDNNCSEESQQEVVDEISELLCVSNLSSILELVLSDLNNLVISNEIQSFLSENSYSCDSYSSAVSYAQSNLDDLEFEDYDIGPSCESFNFQTTTSDAFWQNAAVKNIRFRVVVLSPQGNYVNFDIRFPQPILFGVPTNMVNGGDISSGLAAELSAQALSVTMSEVVNTYGNQPVSELQVRLYFKERLKYNYPIITNGGRATFNPMVLPVVPTEYETNFFGTGNCD